MCGRYSFSSETVERMVRSLKLPPMRDIVGRTNHAPTLEGPVIRSIDTGIELLRWGLSAPWTAAPLINARSESVAEKPAFASAWRHRRCLVPADAFYEWNEFAKPKQPWRFALADPDEPMVIAGIWSQAKLKDGRGMDAYAVLTTSANATVAQLHDRMPVILPEERWNDWLASDTTPEKLTAMHVPYTGSMIGAPVTPAINRVSYQGAIEQVELPPTAAQGELGL